MLESGSYDYYSYMRFMDQPDIRHKIRCRRTQKKRRLAKRRAGKKR